MADAHSTRAFLLNGAKRTGRAAPIRTAFTQIRTAGGGTKPGPLAGLVRNHDETALDLYLLLMALASASPYDVTRDARYWARALDLVDAHGKFDTTKISKAWRRLETRNLVTRKRKGRTASVTPLHESGESTETDAYTAPTGSKTDLYFRVPFEYWLAEDSLHDRLSLAEKAMLLIGLSFLKPEFTLTAENAHRWYGISPETAQRGLKGLEDKGVFSTRRNRVAAPEAPEGYTFRVTYTLRPPFVRTSRRARTPSTHAAGTKQPSTDTP